MHYPLSPPYMTSWQHFPFGGCWGERAQRALGPRGFGACVGQFGAPTARIGHFQLKRKRPACQTSPLYHYFWSTAWGLMSVGPNALYWNPSGGAMAISETRIKASASRASPRGFSVPTGKTHPTWQNHYQPPVHTTVTLI